MVRYLVKHLLSLLLACINLRFSKFFKSKDMLIFKDILFAWFKKKVSPTSSLEIIFLLHFNVFRYVHTPHADVQ